MSAPGRQPQPNTPGTAAPGTGTENVSNRDMTLEERRREAERQEAEAEARSREPLSTADLANADERARAASEAQRQEAQRATSQSRSSAAVRGDERTDEESSPLFAEDASAALRRRWDGIQAAFVDEPRRAVEQADSLVAETMKDLAQSFARARSGLEDQWARGGDVSTEDLRVALRHYRSFFKRLLSV
jgi:hypothetical protein